MGSWVGARAVTTEDQGEGGQNAAREETWTGMPRFLLCPQLTVNKQELGPPTHRGLGRFPGPSGPSPDPQHCSHHPSQGRSWAGRKQVLGISLSCTSSDSAPGREKSFLEKYLRPKAEGPMGKGQASHAAHLVHSRGTISTWLHKAGDLTRGGSPLGP